MSGPTICSRFDPSHTYLAQAVSALDTHQVKVQSLVLTQDLLNATFSMPKGAKLASLEWISTELLALCQTNGTIVIYSPFQNSIVAELESPLNLEVTDFHYSAISHTGWSADINGNIFEWDLQSYKLVQRFALSDMLETAEHVSKLSSVMYDNQPHLLIGTHNVYLVDVLDRKIVKTFPAHVQPIISLQPVLGNEDLFLTAAEGDRFVNIYLIEKQATRAVLVAESAILHVTIGTHGEQSIVAVIVENGSLELFHNPFLFDQSLPEEVSLKKKRKQLASAVKSKRSDAALKFSRPEDEIRTPEDENLYINCVAATETVLHVTWTDHASLARFDALPWLQNADFAFSGSKTVTESKQDIQTPSHAENGHDVAAPKLYDENHTAVTEGNAFQVDLEEDDEEDESLAEKLEKLGAASNGQTKNERKKLNRHTAGTLTVVLSQALKNNDHTLLETVLTNRDPLVVQNTISRLNSSLAVVLLDRLSERITRQQLRFDQLNYWLKWIIIIHGSVLLSMPNMSNQLLSLHAVLTKKASTLPRLLELQGRLNMLQLQNALKQEILAGSQGQEDYDDADTDVEYVEEVDDAIEAGIVDSEDSDIDMDGADDFEESEGEEVDQEEGVEDEEDGLSDVETAVESRDVFE